MQAGKTTMCESRSLYQKYANVILVFKGGCQIAQQLPASSLTLLTVVQFLQASGMLLLCLQSVAAVR